MDELVTLLAYEATRDVRTEEVKITTPVALARCRRLAEPRPIVVPILRAGLGMLEGMTRLLPMAEVSFLGMKRDEDTLEVETYANRLPDDLSGRQYFVTVKEFVKHVDMDKRSVTIKFIRGMIEE